MKEIWPIIAVVVVASIAFVFAWRQGMFLRLSNYWRETMEELHKCSWPTWDELTGSTAVVIVSVGVLGGFTIAVDYLVTQVIRFII